MSSVVGTLSTCSCACCAVACLLPWTTVVVGICSWPSLATSTRHLNTHVTCDESVRRPLMICTLRDTFGCAPSGVTFAPAISSFGCSGAGLSSKPNAPISNVNGKPACGDAPRSSW